MHARVLAESLMHYLLSYQHKNVVPSSFINEQFNYCFLIGMSSSIRSYRKINKLYERSLRLCYKDYISSYNKRSSKQNLVNIHIGNIHQLRIQISKFLKGISPPIMNEIFRLRNIPYTIRNPRDLDGHFPKTLYCGLESTYKRPQLWPTLRNTHCRIGIHINKIRRANLLFYLLLLLSFFSFLLM